VPFGTGKAMQQTKNSGDPWLTTNFQSFREIKILFDSIGELWIRRKSKEKGVQKHIPYLSEGLRAFLHHIDFDVNVQQIAINTSTLISFRKRFFRYFNAFQMIKYMHYMRDRYHPDIHVVTAVKELMAEAGHLTSQEPTAEDLLKLMRSLDRQVAT
ncbi:MAG TPA: hypothetical protein VMZ69_08830, partial [Saprospiraceae bacterium]|nr:hypothetical protein [Saprospiraceae bacterium]